MPLGKLQPKATVYIHIDRDTVETGVAGVGQAGVITTKRLNYLLQGMHVTMRPVIDIPNLPGDPGYRPSTTSRDAVI